MQQKVENETTSTYETRRLNDQTRIADHLDNRYQKKVNHAVYEMNLKQLREQQKCYDDVQLQMAEKIKTRNAFIGGELIYLVVGLVFVYDLSTGKNLLPNFNTFWYWFLTIVLLIIGVAFIPYIIKLQQIEIEPRKPILALHRDEISRFKAICEAEIKPLFDGYGVNEIYRLIHSIHPDIQIYPHFDERNKAKLEQTVGYTDTMDDNASVKNLLFGYYKGNPFLIYDVFRCDLVNTQYTASKDVSWKTENETTITTHTQTLQGIINGVKAEYHTQRRFEYWNVLEPQLQYRVESKYRLEKSERAKHKHIEKIEQKSINESIEKTFSRLYDIETNDMDAFEMIVSQEAKANLVEFGAYNYLRIDSDVAITKKGYKHEIQSEALKRFWLLKSEQIDEIKHHDYAIYKQKFVELIGNFLDWITYLLAPLECIPSYHEKKIYPIEPNTTSPQLLANIQHESLINEMNLNQLVTGTNIRDVIFKTAFYASNIYLDIVAVDAYIWCYDTKYEKVIVKDDNYINHAIKVEYKDYYQVKQTSYVNIKICPYYFQYSRFEAIVEAHPQKETIRSILKGAIYRNNCLVFKDDGVFNHEANDLLNRVVFYDEK